MLVDRGYTEILRYLMKFVGMSIQDLNERLDHKYSLIYLTRILEGKPMPEVEKDIVATLIKAMAEKVGGCVRKLSSKIRCDKAAQSAFENVVIKHGLELRDIASLTIETCQRLENREATISVKRIATMDVTDVSLWEREIEDILNNLFQGNLFAEEGESQPKAEVSENSKDSASSRLEDNFMATDYYRRPPAQCYRCGAPTSGLPTNRCGCGANWNIPD